MNSTTLQELKAQRMALDAQIQAAEDEIARSGESIVVDGQTFDKVADFEGTLPSPADTDYFPTYRKDSNGDIVATGEITYALLVATFAEEATTILNQAIAAGNTAVENISDAQAAALGAIGQDDSSGARGSALTSIGTAKDNALSAIGQTDSEGARKNALDAITAALTSALASIGQSDTAGARGDAITAIATALANALASIGQTDNEGARKSALDAISTAKTAALSAIGESDTAGARGDAIEAINALYSTISAAITQANTSWDSKVTSDNSAWDSKVSSDNSAFDAKVSTANTTIDQKVATATTKAGEAADSAALAEKWAENPEDEPVEGTGDTAKYSAYHWMKKAEAAANVPVATQTTAGKVYISNSLDDVSGEDKTKTAVDKAVAQALRNMFMGYKTTIGDGSTLTYTITHSLGTQDIMPMIGGDSVPEWELSTVDANSVSITFTEAPAASSITVLILPVRTASTGGGE